MSQLPTSTSSDPVVRRVPFFYGWVMLPIATFAMVATSPGQTYGVSVFNPSIGDALRITSSQLAGAYLIGTLLACLPQSWFGAWMDRYGIRRSMTLAVIMLGAACLFMSQVQNFAMLVAAFLLLRMFGQGMLGMMASNTISMWFNSRLGKAAAMMSLGAAAGIAVVPRISLWMISEWGWRWAYAVQGLTVWAVMLPLLVVLFRDKPEHVGQLPDGELKEHKETKTDDEESLSLDEAIRTRAYWIILGATVLWAMIGTAIMFYISFLFNSAGLSLADVSNFYTVYAISLGIMQVVGGVLADRVRLNALYSISMGASSAAVLVLLGMRSPMLAMLFACTLGAGQGLFAVTSQTVFARYFGRAHLGKIRGTIWTVAVAASAVGPFLTGVIKDFSGEFAPALWLFFGLFAAMTVLAWGATPPNRQRRLELDLTDPQSDLAA